MSINKRFSIEAMDLENAGAVSSTIKKSLIEKGISKAIIKRVSIAVYEAEIVPAWWLRW